MGYEKKIGTRKGFLSNLKQGSVCSIANRRAGEKLFLVFDTAEKGSVQSGRR